MAITIHQIMAKGKNGNEEATKIQLVDVSPDQTMVQQVNQITLKRFHFEKTTRRIQNFGKRYVNIKFIILMKLITSYFLFLENLKYKHFWMKMSYV